MSTINSMLFSKHATTIPFVSEEDKHRAEVRWAVEDVLREREPVATYQKAEPIKPADPYEFVYEPTDVNSFDQMVRSVLALRGRVDLIAEDVYFALKRAGKCLSTKELVEQTGRHPTTVRCALKRLGDRVEVTVTAKHGIRARAL